MKISVFKSMDELSQKASDIVWSEIQKKNNLLLCTASGNSTTETYRKVTESKNLNSTQNLRIVKLDEWGGVEMDNPATCETYLREMLVDPLEIPKENYYSFQSNSENPKQECKRIQQLLDKNGPIDLCVLGLGLNGHIAFNEPAGFLKPDCHITTLSVTSLKHPMSIEMKGKSDYGLTLGMADILKSKKILLLISGKIKAEMTRNLMRKEISTSLPASFLWLHSNVYCLCDEDAYSLVKQNEN